MSSFHISIVIPTGTSQYRADEGILESSHLLVLGNASLEAEFVVALCCFDELPLEV